MFLPFEFFIYWGFFVRRHLSTHFQLLHHLREVFPTELQKEKSESCGLTTSLCPYGKLQTKASAFHSAGVRGVNVRETGHWVNAYNMSRKHCCITAWFKYYTVECVEKETCFSQLENKLSTLLLFCKCVWQKALYYLSSRNVTQSFTIVMPVAFYV